MTAHNRSSNIHDFEGTLSKLGFFCETLSSNPLPPSFELISRFLETLEEVQQYSSQSHVDLAYIQQLLMSAVENVAVGIVVGFPFPDLPFFGDMLKGNSQSQHNFDKT
jgi:hypothetical protein